MEENKKKWYDNKLIVFMLCILIFPLGLYALWKSNTILKSWKIIWTIIISITVIASVSGDNNDTITTTNTTTKDTNTEKQAKSRKYVELVRISGNGDKKSNTFKYSGGKARLRYDFKSDDFGMLAVYVVKEGDDINRQGGFPELMLEGTEKGESNLSHLLKGNYYLQVGSANGNWTVIVEEFK